jgi:hypothetical protein
MLQTNDKQNEIQGISNFMIFLLDKLSGPEYKKILKLQLDYLEQVIKSKHKFIKET